VSPYAHPCTTGSHTIPLYVDQPASLGGPSPPSRWLKSLCRHSWSAHGGVITAWAQDGRKPWAGASQAPPDPKGVRFDRKVCAELLRSSL